MVLSAKTRRPIRLAPFLLASSCVHAALLFSHMLIVHPVGQQETVLSVTLRAPDGTATPAASSARVVVAGVSPQDDHSRVLPASTVASERGEKKNAPSALSGSFRDTGAEGTGSVHESARARVQARLLADLQHYFEYPSLARHRGWEGIVWLSFTVEPDGLLDRIQVAKSSGYDVLDSSAIGAMQRVGRLNDAGYWLNGTPLTMQLAVIYRLKDR